MRIILENMYFPQGLFVLVVAGIVSQMITWKSYHRMLVDSEEMEGKKKRWIGILRKRFESYYQLEAKLHNISCIVDKELNKNKICGLPETWVEKGSLICAMGCFFLGCLGVLRNYIKGIHFNSSILGLLVFVMAGCLLVGIYQVFDVTETRSLIRSNMIHFLENILPNRCEKKERKAEPKKEKKPKPRAEEHWEEIAATKEYTLTPEEIKIMKEFLNEI